jgi:CheY-like chemotaxis protein
MGCQRILVVDDDKLIRMSLSLVLRRDGFDVDAVASGREAIELLERERYDLVVTDLRLEDLDGLEISAWTRRLNPEARVVVITGSEHPPSAEGAARFGADRVVLKPFALSVFVEEVARLLESSRTSPS